MWMWIANDYLHGQLFIDALQNSCFEKYRKFYRNLPVIGYFLDKVPALHIEKLVENNSMKGAFL